MNTFPPPSFWESDLLEVQPDLTIIGAGLVGLSAALKIKTLQPDWNVLVLEKTALPTGASTRNAGFACFGSPTELLSDLQSMSETEVWNLVQRRWTGLQKLRNRLGDKALQYEEWGGYEVFQDQASFQQSLDALPMLNKALAEITGHASVFEVVPTSDFPFKGVKGMIRNALEGQLHPGRMMQALRQKVRDAGVLIWNGVGVEAIEASSGVVQLAIDAAREIQTKRLLVATNGFSKRLLPELNVLPARNQVLITEPIPNLGIKGCFHAEEGYFYFRNVGNRLLLGGGRHLSPKDEQTDSFGHTSIIEDALQQMLSKVILPGKSFRVDQRWSGILGVGPVKSPILKWLHSNVLVSVRLGGMGVAIGMDLGEQAATMISDAN